MPKAVVIFIRKRILLMSKFNKKIYKRYTEEAPVSDVIKNLITSYNLKSGIDKIVVKQAWEKIMGAGINNYTTHIVLKQTTLYVGLSSAILREELNLGREKIVAMLNEELGEELIAKVILR